MTWFAVVDTARDARLFDLVSRCSAYVPLFAGPLQPPLDRAVPYLVEFERGGPLMTAWMATAASREWGLLVDSTADLPALRRHFRQFLQATLPDGRIVLFRFYDPRVFHAYLPSCDTAALQAWFRPVRTYYVGGPQRGRSYAFDGTALRISERAEGGDASARPVRATDGPPAAADPPAPAA